MKERKLRLGAYDFTVFEPEGACGGVVYLPMNGGAEEIRRLMTNRQTALIAVSGFDWNRDLSPWPAKAVFGEEDFSGGADAFLDSLTRLIPEVERTAQLQPVWRGVAGYSLAGLLAVYAVYRCGLFTRAASVSGSMWYDGWLDYARETPFAAAVTHAYFSVGAKEKKTRNVRMASVGDCTRAMNGLFSGRGVKSLFELNPGNHFAEPGRRTARALDCLSEE